VIEVEPGLKRRLYSALAAESGTLKAWFIEAASKFLQEREQPRLPIEVKKKQKRGRRS
jgi:hypothetical protein